MQSVTVTMSLQLAVTVEVEREFGERCTVGGHSHDAVLKAAPAAVCTAAGIYFDTYFYEAIWVQSGCQVLTGL